MSRLERVVRRIALIVNPDAGLGGKVGLKGSDGQAELARSMGADDRAGPRMRITLAHLLQLSNLSRLELLDIEWFACAGRMGLDWVPEELLNSGKWQTIHTPGDDHHTSHADTNSAVVAAVHAGCDMILYAGGDGTTRDIVATLSAEEFVDLTEESVGLIGVPAGVKMHSGCFGATPAAAAEALAAWLSGDLLLGRTEVMDLDEERYRRGEWVVRMYGEVMTPSSPRWMQGSKQRIESSGEDEVIEALAEYIGELGEEEPERLFIWGSGGTLRAIAAELGMESTLLGIDAVRAGEMIGSDLNEAQLLELIEANHLNDKRIPKSKSPPNEDRLSAPVTVLLSPMGGQGFLIGRGNLQLSPAVLRAVGIENVLGVVTPAKMATLSHLRIDSGDVELDEDFREQRYIKALQGYRTTRLVRVAED